MPTFERILSLPPDRQSGELFRQTMVVRSMLERAWSAETAYQGITLTPEDVPSRGQCGVSIVWYARFLANQGIDARFNEGLMYVGNHKDGDEHVWAEIHGVGTDEEPLVADLTSDQYRTIFGTTVHLGQYDNEAPIIGRYETQAQFLPYEIPHKKLMARFAILEENVSRLPFWRKLKVR